LDGHRTSPEAGRIGTRMELAGNADMDLRYYAMTPEDEGGPNSRTPPPRFTSGQRSLAGCAT
jgi:hypothetical protein